MINNKLSSQQTELKYTISSTSTKTTTDRQLPISLAADLPADEDLMLRPAPIYPVHSVESVLTPIVSVSSSSEPMLTSSAQIVSLQLLMFT